tara:strand:- start:58 stop:792 length:735 start_codon:yes stop_codon:yes gene_type:complete
MPCADIEVKRANGRDWYARNREKCIEKARQRRRSPQYLHYLEASREKRREYKRKIRLEKGCVPREILSLRTAIKNIPQAPTVLDLVKTQQKEYWIERRKTPEGRADYTKHLYNTNVSTRLMQKEKRQRNKFKERNLYVEKITKKELLNRCALFNYCCAYCGKPAGIDIELEHVIPRSKDGPHCLSNIIPACHSCNQSKRAQDMSKWYKQQSFYSYKRLQRIEEVLSSTPYPAQQKELFLDWQTS